MIKYLELTAPESDEFRQAKILSVEVNEGDSIKVGDTLFMVMSGKQEIALPAKLDGKVVELIAMAGENISYLSPLLLLETHTERSTATPQIESSVTKNTAEQTNNKEPKKSKTNSKKKKTHSQQSLDLDDTPSASEKTSGPSSMKTSKQKVSIPDIGTDAANIIEILVKVGDTISIEDPIATLESDKASMEVPSDKAGKVTAILVNIDDEVAEGTALIEIETQDAASEAGANSGEANESPAASSPAEDRVEDNKSGAESNTETNTATRTETIVEVRIPNIGGDSAKVIEILVAVGDSVEVEDPLIVLESDKASMEVPSSASGVVQSIELKLDQEASEDMVVATVLSKSAVSNLKPSKQEKAEDQTRANTATAEPAVSVSTPEPVIDNSSSHASPSVRRFARELGVALSQISGSGRKGRISKDDVKAFVKRAMTAGTTATNAGTASGGSGIPTIPAVDFSKFGDIELQPLNRIKKLTAANLHRSWLNVPHVTHNDESNISELEKFRKELNAEYAAKNKAIKLSPLAFTVKAVVSALQEYPQFNSSLDESGDNLILKKYFNIGIAVDTPNGLVVPVIKDADKLSISEIAIQMGELAAKARDKKLTMNDISGACFSISSLGGIGGTSFTPIVNAPEVAILGVSRGKMSPIWDGEAFIPGLVLPLSLSYDHRVIDGAEAARFTRHIAAALEDVRRLAL